MNICRDIYYNGTYSGCFQLKNVEGKFMWCPIYGSQYTLKALRKNSDDNPYNDYSHPYFIFEESDLDLTEEVNGNNC